MQSVAMGNKGPERQKGGCEGPSSMVATHKMQDAEIRQFCHGRVFFFLLMYAKRKTRGPELL